MKYLLFILLINITSLNLQAANTWKWAGYEIVGNKTVDRAEIEKLLTINMGSEYKADMLGWKEMCDQLKSKLKLAHVYCSSVRFLDFKAYLTVNIVEKGEEHRFNFKPTPKEDIAFASDEMLKIYELLLNRRNELFSQGKGSREDASKGYLDYDDEKMSGYVSQLVKVVPKYRKNLIDVLKNDKDQIKRGKAATLLNWALDVESSIAEVHKLLDDPSVFVRNNISRFMLHFFSLVKDEKLKEKAIKSLATQLSRPSHADRNKAVYGLLEIAKSDKSMRPIIKKFALEELSYLASTSILKNVKDPAIELRDLILL